MAIFVYVYSIYGGLAGVVEYVIAKSVSICRRKYIVERIPRYCWICLGVVGGWEMVFTYRTRGQLVVLTNTSTPLSSAKCDVVVVDYTTG